MRYRLEFTADAERAYNDLGRDDAHRFRKAQRALGRLETDPRHPGLASHEYESFPIEGKVKVWGSYVENRMPSAWRLFWRYGPDRIDDNGRRVPVITVLAITPHP